MSATVLTTSQSHHPSRIRALSILATLAIAPVVYFAACSSGGDDGGGGGGTPPGNNPVGAANQFAYVINSGVSEIQAYSMDGSGNLTAIGGGIATGVVPHHVDVDRAGRFVYVSNHNSNFVSGWRINSTGGLDPMNPAPGSPVTADVEPHSSVMDQTGEYLYVVSGTGASTLRAYKINTTAGPTLGIPTPITGTSSFPVGTHGHNVTISPNNLFLYVAAEDSGEVHAFSRDTATGALTPQGVMSGMPVCDAVTVSPDNKFLFAAYANAVDVFSIAANGALTRITPVATFSTNNFGFGSGPHSIAIHPNGQTLYTANINPNPGRVSVFRVDTNTGALTELQNPPPTTGQFPNYIAIHPNQQFLFTADQGPGALTRFAINADGTLATPGTAIPAGSGANGIATTKF
jgi:6-phosphogluconolactonase (cycloisomerase 2 family)